MNIYIDGSGWNGKQCGYAIAMENGEQIVRWFSEEHTNNEMEYQALLNALYHNAQKDDVILSDSQLVVNQVTKGWKVNFPHLKRLCDDAKKLLADVGCQLKWIPREQNLAGHLLEKEK